MQLSQNQINETNRLKLAKYLQFYEGVDGLDYYGTKHGFIKEWDKKAIEKLNSTLSGFEEGTDLQYLRGDKSWQTLDTSVVPENVNQYFTQSRARTSISESITGIEYDSSTGIFSLTSGYVIPTTTEESNWNTAYLNYLDEHLADSKIFVGSSGGFATARTLTLNSSTGSFNLSNTGVLTFPDGDATTRGLINITTQTIVGVKTFNSMPILNAGTSSYSLFLNSSKAISIDTTSGKQYVYDNITSTLVLGGTAGIGNNNRLLFPTAVTASTLYGLISIGGGFGSSSAWSGSSGGTYIAINSSTGNVDILNYQSNGTGLSKALITSDGFFYSGNTASTSATYAQMKSAGGFIFHGSNSGQDALTIFYSTNSHSGYISTGGVTFFGENAFSGSSSLTGTAHIFGSITNSASGGVGGNGKYFLLNGSFAASANTQSLYELYLDTALTVGAFSGTVKYGIWQNTTDRLNVFKSPLQLYDYLRFVVITLSTAVDGKIEYNNSFYATKNSGLRFGFGGVIDSTITTVGNSTTTETDLYSFTTPASTLANDSESLEMESGGAFISSATATREIKVYFGGNVIFDTGTLTLSLSSQWTLYVSILRSSTTKIRYIISLTTEGAALAAYTASGEQTGLTLSNTNILKITGQAAGVGAATNDITLLVAKTSWFPNPNL